MPVSTTTTARARGRHHTAGALVGAGTHPAVTTTEFTVAPSRDDDPDFSAAAIEAVARWGSRAIAYAADGLFFVGRVEPNGIAAIGWGASWADAFRQADLAEGGAA